MPSTSEVGHALNAPEEQYLCRKINHKVAELRRSSILIP